MALEESYVLWRQHAKQTVDFKLQLEREIKDVIAANGLTPKCKYDSAELVAGRIISLMEVTHLLPTVQKLRRFINEQIMDRFVAPHNKRYRAIDEDFLPSVEQ
jgi:hypothetical protein